MKWGPERFWDSMKVLVSSENNVVSLSENSKKLQVVARGFMAEALFVSLLQACPSFKSLQFPGEIGNIAF